MGVIPRWPVAAIPIDRRLPAGGQFRFELWSYSTDSWGEIEQNYDLSNLLCQWT